MQIEKGNIQKEGYSDLQSIVGSLYYLEKEAERARLLSVQCVLNEAISKISSDTERTNSVVRKVANDEYLFEKLTLLLSFFKLASKFECDDIHALLLALADQEGTQH